MSGAGRRSHRRWKPSVLAALARGEKLEAAAAAGRVSQRTVSRWLQDARCRALIEQLRGQALDRTIGTVSDLALGALTTLDQIRTDINAPPAARVSACRTM